MGRRAAWCRYRLDFRFVARTSRETMTSKDTYFLKLWDDTAPEVFGIGECGLFRGLSSDDRPDYEQRLDTLCRAINRGEEPSTGGYSSITMGYETALADLARGGRRIVFDSPWAYGDGQLTINGLVWMGSPDEMLRRIDEKLSSGFHCLKMKIGGVRFEDELKLIAHIRSAFGPDCLTLRVDANGAFSPADALDRLDRLARFDIHSIEQPVRAGQPEEMARICGASPIPVALDEELIGIDDDRDKIRLLSTVRPQYIILKPTLAGGFASSMAWIEAAEALGIGWWITSALESNIGLNAIAQWAASLDVEMPQGLGTGQLYHNNIVSPLRLDGDRLYSDADGRWEIPQLQWIEP